jgi:hypothetical protein
MKLKVRFSHTPSAAQKTPNYIHCLCRRFVWLDKADPAFSKAAGRVQPESEPPTIGDGKPHGAYFWKQVRLLVIGMKLFSYCVWSRVTFVWV